MDVPTQRINDVVEIEKQVTNPDATTSGPKMLSETPEKDRSVLVNLLAALGISVIGVVAVIFLLAIPFSSKRASAPQTTVTTETMQIGSQPNVVIQTEYVNPFATTSQYTNPFIATKNPFTVFAQQ